MEGTDSVTKNFKYDRYSIETKVISQKRLSITILDPIERVEYHADGIDLENIVVETLLQAFDQSN